MSTLHAASPFFFRILIFTAVLTCGGSCLKTNRSNPLDTELGNTFVAEVKTPSGGEQLFPGTVYLIRWIPALQVSEKAITIQLVHDGDTTTVARDFPNSGQHFWRVPDLPAQTCRILVVGSGGAGESPAPFRIKPLPNLQKLNIGGANGSSPTALRDKVVFESDRDGNSDRWMLDRDTDALVRMTSNLGRDTEAAWFKPSGKVFAYTAYADAGTSRDVWICVTEGVRAGRYRVTTDGGYLPAWQNTDIHLNLALAYIKPVPPSSPETEQIYAVTLNSLVAALPIVTTPVTYASSVFSLTSPAAVLQRPLRTLTWAYVDDHNELLYVTTAGLSDRPVFRVRFSRQDYANASITPYSLAPEWAPDKISVSPSGRYIAFGAGGDIYVASIQGLNVSPVTFGDAQDAAPDWATEDELVFQRRSNFVGWELWSVKLSDPP
ncbi:MAG: hypothetical protein FJY97_05915 [candidate division Zixibacteria bacterium]|nr:hypothetical protein [candidate division Zixibacteria bacterium]